MAGTGVQGAVSRSRGPGDARAESAFRPAHARRRKMSFRERNSRAAGAQKQWQSAEMRRPAREKGTKAGGEGLYI
jgi:hypothetical protein